MVRPKEGAPLFFQNPYNKECVKVSNNVCVHICVTKFEMIVSSSSVECQRFLKTLYLKYNEHLDFFPGEAIPLFEPNPPDPYLQ